MAKKSKSDKVFKILQIISVLSSLSLATIEQILELVKKDKRAAMTVDNAISLQYLSVSKDAKPVAKAKLDEVEKTIAKLNWM